VAKVLAIIACRAWVKLTSIDVVMIATRHCVVVRLEKCWEVVTATWFVTTLESAVEPTSVLAVIANKSVKMNHTRTISRTQGQEWTGCKYAISRRVPDTKALLLNCSEVMQTREEKRVNNLRLVGSGDKTTYENILLLVPQVWRMIKDDPDVDPTVRRLVPIKLRPVNRKHEDHVTRSDFAFRYSVEIVLALEEIIIRLKHAVSS
jgi:hypothetical protein